MSLRILRTCLFAGILLAGYNPLYSEPRPEQPPVTANGASIAYHLDRSMRVSINVYDADGQIVRALMNGAPRSAGQVVRCPCKRLASAECAAISRLGGCQSPPARRTLCDGFFF